MKTFRIFFLLLASALVTCTAQNNKNDSIHVLFIGNSFTYYNNLPKMLQSVASAIAPTSRMKIAYKACVPGGCTLKKHSQTSEEINIIKQEKWDYVVLQEHSIAPARPSYVVEKETYAYAHYLDSLIMLYHPKAKVIFFMTWGHKNGCLEPIGNYPLIDTYEGMQERLKISYLEMTYANKAWCAPVGMAWKVVRTERPFLSLYMNDGYHPSPLGTYLAANVIFATIYQNHYQSDYLNGIDPETAEYLQQVAQQTVLSNKRLLNIAQ